MIEQETETFRREATVELQTDGDGRTLISRLVPYNQPATVTDDGVRAYKEMFVPGAFKAQTRAAHRIKAFLNFRHGQGLQDQIGHVQTLEERDDGLYGELRVLDHPDGDKALAMIRAGTLDKLSIEFAAVKSAPSNGVMQRVKARLLGVALVPVGSYDGAQVMAIREAEDGDEDDDERSGVSDEWAPRPVDPSLVTRLARHIDIPDEMLVRAFTDTAWDGSSGRWPDAESFCRSCVIDDNPGGATKIKALCHLPVREPDTGDVNINAVRDALARVDQVATSDANKASARRTLERLLAQFNAQN